MIGRTIGHYRILARLGEGAMGIVYKAQDERLQRLVAIKIIPPELTVSETDRLRFIQETRSATSLSHPNIASVYGIEQTPEHTFIVFEFVDGRTLRDKRERLSVEETRRVAGEIADGLRAAHDAGVIHRDIRPGNIMIAAGGHVKILDFGVVRLAGRFESTGGTGVDTLAYASPEQIQGGEVDARTDLWSLGVVLYELLAGKRPFKGDNESEILYEILNGEPKAIQDGRDDVGPELRMLVSRLLEKNPAKRLPTAAAVVEWLRRRGPVEKATGDKIPLSVLYFENASPDKENDYVSVGLSEDVIGDLSKIRGLNVVSRNDVLPFRNRDVDAQELGESLGVAFVLEGTVRKSGDVLRIGVRLTDVATGFHVWVGRFDRLLEDIFEVRAEIANGVASALGVSLTDSEKQAIAARPTSDVRAYDFYLRAREFLSRSGRKRAEGAIRMLRNATVIDPQFVLAYTSLAEAYSSMYTYYDGDQAWLDKAIEASRKAVELDPGLVEGHFILGLVYFHQRDFEKARRNLQDVIRLKPYYYEAYWWLGIISDITGDYDAALEYYELSAAIKPYSVEPWLYMNMTHRRKGDLEAAKLSAKRFLEVGLRRLEINPNDAVTLSRFAVIYTLFGEHDKALAVLNRILEQEPDDGIVLYNCASTYALLNDSNQALRCMRIALEHGFKNILEWVKSDPDFDRMRNTDAFRSLIKEFAREEPDRHG